MAEKLAPAPAATSSRRFHSGRPAHCATRLARAAPASWGAASRPSETPIPTVTIESTPRAMLRTKSSRPSCIHSASLTSVPPVEARPSTRSATVTITAAITSATTRRHPGEASTLASSV